MEKWKEWNKFSDVISEFCDKNEPLIYLMDNINLFKGLPVYRGITHKIHSLTMLNFTVEAVLKPELDGLKWMLNDKSVFQEPQKSINDLKAEDAKLGMSFQIILILVSTKDRSCS